MPKFVVEREIPGIGAWSAGQRQKAAEKSRAVLRELDCVYIAPGPELIKEHATPGRLPVQSGLRGAGDDGPALVMEPARAFFREAGRGAAVVCIHSSASSSAQWRPLMDRLASRFRTLAVDLYGSGKSPMWPAARPLALADEVALARPRLCGRRPVPSCRPLLRRSSGPRGGARRAGAGRVPRPVRARAVLGPDRRGSDPGRGPGDRRRA